MLPLASAKSRACFENDASVTKRPAPLSPTAPESACTSGDPTFPSPFLTGTLVSGGDGPDARSAHLLDRPVLADAVNERRILVGSDAFDSSARLLQDPDRPLGTEIRGHEDERPQPS